MEKFLIALLAALCWEYHRKPKSPGHIFKTRRKTVFLTGFQNAYTGFVMHQRAGIKALYQAGQRFCINNLVRDLPSLSRKSLSIWKSGKLLQVSGGCFSSTPSMSTPNNERKISACSTISSVNQANDWNKNVSSQHTNAGWCSLAQSTSEFWRVVRTQPYTWKRKRRRKRAVRKEKNNWLYKKWVFCCDHSKAAPRKYFLQMK